MNRYASVFLLFVLTAVCMVSLSHAEANSLQRMTDSSPKLYVRKKRVVLGLSRIVGLSRYGRQALEKLKVGATVVSETKSTRYFEKPGNFDTAVKDFESVNPEIYRGTKTSRDGKIGDRNIKIRKVGYGRKPTLYLIRKPRVNGRPSQIDVFIYKD